MRCRAFSRNGCRRPTPKSSRRCSKRPARRFRCGFRFRERLNHRDTEAPRRENGEGQKSRKSSGPVLSALFISVFLLPFLLGASVSRWLVPHSLSVRNGPAGSPSLFDRFGSAIWLQPKRTATGFVTASADTTTVLPSISALASTNFLSSPAIVNQL